ncbi:MAG: division/cell wall cluster transcriptional repressor MraZ [Dehalococcoidales bacterium]|jgi:MraZ protein|nr:division/cell wall cluster transcriptional repressor MraZ [Dehalococcoidales bacterium]
MFLGEFEYKIDEKGRVPIPPKFRRELKDGVVLAAGPEKCIIAYSLVEWKKVAATLTSSTMAASKIRRLNRAFFASAFNLSVDGQGRIALPIPLREYAGIEDELIIAGANTYLELWNKEQWDTEKEISREQAWQIIESLERH